MNKKIVLNPGSMTEPIGCYSPGVCVDLMTHRAVFISGQVASSASGEIVHAGNAAAQTQFVFKQIASILTEAGGSLSDLVSLTIYVTNMDHFYEVSSVRNEVLQHMECPPSSTFVEVSRLAVNGHLVEISGIALITRGNI